MRTSPDVEPLALGGATLSVPARTSVVERFAPAPVREDTSAARREHGAARAAGYAEGWAAGSRAAVAELERTRTGLLEAERRREQDAENRTAAVLSALDAAAAGLDARQAPVLTELSDVVLRAAVEVAETLLGRELETCDDAGLTAVRRALSALGGTRPVTVRLHPTDLATLAPADWPAGVTGTPDPSLRRGDAVAEHAGGSVDARLSSALERVREAVAR